MLGARRTALFCFVLLVACNSIVGFDSLTKTRSGETPVEGTGDDDDDVVVAPKVDADTPAPPRCDPKKAFGDPVLVSTLDPTVDTRRAVMTPDELEVFYLRGTSAPYELRHSIRKSNAAAWGEPTTEVLSPGASELGSLAASGLKLYYWQIDDTGGSSGTLATFPFVATRTRLQGAFGPGTKLLSETDRSVVVPDTDDGAYWATYVTLDGGAFEKFVLRGSLVGTRVFDGVIVPGLHTAKAQDEYPVLGKGELTLYFASQRSGSGTVSDIYRATRASRTAPFDLPVLVPELSSASVERPSWVSNDDCVILFDRAKHIFSAQRAL